MIRYLTALIVFVNLLFAHPHTFIDIFPTIDNKNNNIKTIHFSWSFDEMTSQLLIMEFDQNFNGKIDKEEISYIKENYFDSLSEYNFYTDIKLSNKSIKTKPINFKAAIKDNMRVTYEFDVVINKNKDDVKIEFYDTEMFTAFMLKKEFIKSDLGFKIVDVDNDIYFAYKLQFN